MTHIEPLDPDTPAGKAAADAISEALAHVIPRVLARRNNSSKADAEHPDDARQPE